MAEKKRPVLVIMAAGMGSRYGGLKQMDPVDEFGNIILDYSIYDAVKAGFADVVCIIKQEIERPFLEMVGKRLSEKVNLKTAYQELHMLPKGFSIPDGRVKPWGTGHAILCAKDAIDSPFAVINADDYYGPEAFLRMYEFLSAAHAPNAYAMMGYPIEKTLTENGAVTRGICKLNEEGYLLEIHETRGVFPLEGGGAYQDATGKEIKLPKGTPVSMNFFGLNPSFLQELKEEFPRFLSRECIVNPLTCEFLLPGAVQDMVQAKKASVLSLDTQDQWFGVTYQADMPIVKDNIRKLKAAGLYPEALWQ